MTHCFGIARREYRLGRNARSSHTRHLSPAQNSTTTTTTTSICCCCCCCSIRSQQPISSPCTLYLTRSAQPQSPLLEPWPKPFCARVPVLARGNGATPEVVLSRSCWAAIQGSGVLLHVDRRCLTSCVSTTLPLCALAHAVRVKVAAVLTPALAPGCALPRPAPSRICQETSLDESPEYHLPSHGFACLTCGDQAYRPSFLQTGLCCLSSGKSLLRSSEPLYRSRPETAHESWFPPRWLRLFETDRILLSNHHYNLSYRSSTYGLLYYDPAKHHNENDKPQRVYRPRRVGPGRVCIRSVDPKKDRDGLYVPFAVQQKETTPLKRESFNLKLASTRENARRFLKSVISATPANDSQLGEKKDNAWKRRSWSPTKRTNSQQSGESGGGPGEAPANSTAEGSLGTVASGAAAMPATTMRGNIRNSIGGPINAHLQRPRLNSAARDGSTPSVQSVASSTGSTTTTPRMESNIIDSAVIPNLNLDDEKPIVAGNGVAVGIHLAEPVLFLQGFENSDNQPGNTAMLRGGLHLRVSKSAKIKAITLKFKGTAVTKWPEGIPPRKVEFEERDTIMSHTWPFFNAQFESAERGTNADHVQLSKDGFSSTVTRLDTLGRSTESNSSVNLNSREAKKLALSVNQSRSFGKGETPGGPTVAAKGYRMFLPGDYVYNFEMPIDSRLPETIDVELGSVKYELEAIIERSGAFRSNLVGNKEITIIRAPAEGSLECVEPIAISRNWEDQLHYDIVISGKSFPLGTQIPIAFKLTPLAKVQCHRIKVLVTENTEYFCSNKRVHRMEPTRKVQLFEKRADGAPTSTFPGSTMRVTSGGGIPHNQRAAAARGEDVIPNDTTNLLGNLDLGDSHIGPTEMEFNVQLPSCHNMKDRDRTQRLHFDTTYQNIQVHHWIKIVMRLSKPDVNDPSKRRHFEISIDSPFHILSCRATQANISLPAYTSPESGPTSTTLSECGCPGAAQRRNSPPNLVPALNALNTQQTSRQSSITPLSPGLTRPPTVHARDAHIGRPQSIDRPIHLLRAPSFNPPPFSEEEPPPPLITPPPQYDSIASPTSGLADYFARLSDTYEDEDSSGDESRPGRVNVPLTPGGRINRSVDLGRGWAPLATQMPLSLPRREV